MSRSGYNDDCDNDWGLICWRGAVTSAIKGKRGQEFLYEMLHALAALPEPKLIANDLEAQGSVCALGAVGKARGIDMTGIDPEDREKVAEVFGIAPALAAEIVWMNDEAGRYWHSQDKEGEDRARFDRMRKWIEEHLLVTQ